MSREAQRPRVLVAEDGKLNRLFLERTLQALGMDCDVAENGLQAVEACARQPYDWVFMDCQMPVMDGYEAAKAIRRAKGAAIQIIAVTGSDSQADRDRCLAAGMDHVLVKPISAQDIRNCLSRSLPERSAAPEAERAETVLDQAVRMLMQDSGLNREFCIQMTSEFVALAHALMEDILRVRIEEDAVTLGRLLHQLKGTAGNVRVLCVSEAAKAGEAALAAKDWEALDKQLAVIAETTAAMVVEQ